MTDRSSLISDRKKIKIYCIILLFLISILLSSFFTFLNPDKIYCSSNGALYDTDIDINAESAIIVNYETGDILWEKNSSRKMHPASLTKMLSSIVAIENIKNLKEIIEIPVNSSGRNHSAFRFRTGDKITLLDLIKAALISSHNNAIVALAEYVSGDSEDFVELMNIKAKDIGANNSFFQNTNGLDDEFPYHKSTALDMAKIAAYCMGNDLFSKTVATEKDTIKINNREVEITNTNNLLEYDYIEGIKTGYTGNAGFCMALYSEKESLKLITVVLNSETQEERNNDILKLLTWAYDNLKYTKIVDSQKPAVTVSSSVQTLVNINLYPETDFVKLINIKSDIVNYENNINTNIILPVKENEILGSINVFINDKKMEEINLISRENIGSDYTYQELSTAGSGQTLFILILLMVFYFLIFITIIVRNSLSKRNL